MKKTMLLLFGLFTFVACNEDVTSETIDEQQEESMTPFTIDPAIPYESPFSGFYVNEDIPYRVDNQFTDEIEIVGHFGLAYFDDADDGMHFLFDLINNITPTIYNNSTEYLNTIYSTEVSFPSNAGTTPVTMIGGSRCPVYPILGSPSFLVDSSYGNGNGVGMEPEVIYQAGKMYFLDVNIPSLGYSTTIKVKFGDDSMDFANLSSLSSDWNLVGGSINGIPGDLVYHTETGEICLANDAMGNGLLSEDSFVDRIGTTWYIRAFTDSNRVYITVTL